MMEIQIVSKDAKPLLSRTEVAARIAFQGATPTRKEVIKALAKALGEKEDLIILRRIDTAFGSQSGKVLGYVYNDRKALETLEHESVLKKHGAGKEEKKTEGPKAAEKTGGDE